MIRTNSDYITLGQGHTPHIVIADPEGAPWIIDVGLNSIVRAIPVSLIMVRATESFRCSMLKQKSNVVHKSNWR